MLPDVYANFLESIGHRVIKSETCWWYDVFPHVFIGFPFHVPIIPLPGEIQSVLGLSGIAARHCCPENLGRDSFMYVCDDQNYKIDNLSSKTRRNIRWGLKRCAVRRITFKELEYHGGLELNSETLLRQNRDVPEGHNEYWRRFYRAARSCEALEAWGAFVGNELAAYLISCQINDCANIILHRSHRKHLKAYPNNAMLYEFIQDVISRPHVSVISYGLEPVKMQSDSMDYFKSAMGFVRRPIGQRIEFNRLFRPILTKPAIKFILSFTERRLLEERYNKLSGMLRWFLDQSKEKAATR